MMGIWKVTTVGLKYGGELGNKKGDGEELTAKR
jgi:hypothetical protein